MGISGRPPAHSSGIPLVKVVCFFTGSVPSPNYDNVLHDNVIILIVIISS